MRMPKDQKNQDKIVPYPAHFLFERKFHCACSNITRRNLPFLRRFLSVRGQPIFARTAHSNFSTRALEREVLHDLASESLKHWYSVRLWYVLIHSHRQYKIKYSDKLDLAYVLLLQMCQCRVNSELCAPDSPTRYLNPEEGVGVTLRRLLLLSHLTRANLL